MDAIKGSLKPLIDVLASQLRFARFQAAFYSIFSNHRISTLWFDFYYQ